MMVQVFFAWRIKVLSGSLWAALLIGMFAVLECCGSYIYLSHHFPASSSRIVYALTCVDNLTHSIIPRVAYRRRICSGRYRDSSSSQLRPRLPRLSNFQTCGDHLAGLFRDLRLFDHAHFGVILGRPYLRSAGMVLYPDGVVFSGVEEAQEWLCGDRWYY